MNTEPEPGEGSIFTGWKQPVDKGYAVLIGALRRKAEELVAESDNFLIDADSMKVISAPAEAMKVKGRDSGEKHEVEDFVVIPAWSNSAWAIVRASGPGLFLLRGTHTFGGELEGVASDSGGAAVVIEHVRWNPRVLEVMKLIAGKSDLARQTCDCGHMLDRRPMHNIILGASQLINSCPGCGYLGADPEVWKDSKNRL